MACQFVFPAAIYTFGPTFRAKLVGKRCILHNIQMFEELYDYYSRGSSYFVTPGAVESLRRIRSAGALTVVGPLGPEFVFAFPNAFVFNGCPPQCLLQPDTCCSCQFLQASAQR